MTKVQEFLEKLEEAYFILSDRSSYIVSSKERCNTSKEQMEEKIVKLIYDRIKKHKLVDEDFLSNLVEIMVCSRGLNPYVRELEFLPYHCGEIAYYNVKNNLLAISCSYINKHFPYGWASFNANEKEYYHHIYAVSTIAHEMEHAEQKRKMLLQPNDITAKITADVDMWREDIESIYSKIFLVSATWKKNWLQRKYDRYWNFDPSERLANIYSEVITIDTIEGLNQMFEMNTLIEKANQRLCDMLLFGYERKNSPTHYYYKKLNIQNKWKEIALLIPTLSLEDRLLLGLDITEEEYFNLLENEDEIVKNIQKKYK